MSPQSALMLAACAILMAANVSSNVDASSPVTVHIGFVGAGWAALRVNLTADNDLTATVQRESCHDGATENRTVVGGAVFYSLDRKPGRWGIQAGESAWGPLADSTEVGANGNVVRLPENLPTSPNCSGMRLSLTAPNLGVHDRFVYVAINSAPCSSVDFTLSWTHGVTSYDVSSGSAIVRTKGEFDRGVHASVCPLVDASAGVLAQQQVHAKHDLIGWFWPTLSSSHQTSVWSCQRASGACPTVEPGSFAFLHSHGAEDWTFSVDAEATPGEPAYYALGVAVLPDDGYLSG